MKLIKIAGAALAEKAIGRKLTWETGDTALQNIQARARSPMIWLLANIFGFILLVTCNRIGQAFLEALAALAAERRTARTGSHSRAGLCHQATTHS